METPPLNRFETFEVDGIEYEAPWRYESIWIRPFFQLIDDYPEHYEGQEESAMSFLGAARMFWSVRKPTERILDAWVKDEGTFNPYTGHFWRFRS